MTYLIEKRNLSKDMAKDVYALFGGRLKSLQNAATKIKSGVPFSSTLKSCYSFRRKLSVFFLSVQRFEQQL
jgi:hypothetical protein